MNKINKNIHYISTALMALISLIGLIFPLAKITGGLSENGFNMISFASNIVSDSYKALLYIMGAFAILQLVAVIMAFVYFMITIYAKEKANEKTLSLIFNIIYMSLLFIYMTLGIVFVILANDGLGFNYYTLSYIPFVLGACVFVFYFINLKMNGTSDAKAKPAKIQKSKSEDEKTAA